MKLGELRKLRELGEKDFADITICMGN